jgi:integrase
VPARDVIVEVCDAPSVCLPEINSDASVLPAIDSTAKGATVARRRFQRGSVFKNRTRTVWLGMYSEYVLDSNGVEKRHRRQIVLGPIRKPDGSDMTKREAQRLLQPFVDRVNAAIAFPSRERKSATFQVFSRIWERDYLSLSKPSTQCSMRSQLKRLTSVFGNKDMRQIDAGDLQRIIAAMEVEGRTPKTIRNMWATVRLIWDAALAQKYVDSLLPRSKLKRRYKKTPRYFLLNEVAKIIAHSEGDSKALYWLAAESGARAGELCALRLADVHADRITVNQSVWHGRFQPPKTDNSVRSIALSPELGEMLSKQKERQLAEGRSLLFSTKTGGPIDSSLFVKRKLKPFLASLNIAHGGLHGMRHFNASILSALCVPLKVIQVRLGHASSGCLTLDVYTHSEWEQNVEAAKQVGQAIQKAVNSVSLTAIQQKRLADGNQQVLEAA